MKQETRITMFVAFSILLLRPITTTTTLPSTTTTTLPSTTTTPPPSTTTATPPPSTTTTTTTLPSTTTTPPPSTTTTPPPSTTTATRPPPENAAEFARWLVGESSWGVLSTLDAKSGSPFGNVVSFADGSTGIPYFYLSTNLDPTGPNALNNNQSSFTISEVELGTCSQDPQSPVCSKITLSGQLHLLPNSTKEGQGAEAALFAKHPMLAGWPKRQGSFAVFKLVIGDIFLVNQYAPIRRLTVRDYLRYCVRGNQNCI